MSTVYLYEAQICSWQLKRESQVLGLCVFVFVILPVQTTLLSPSFPFLLVLSIFQCPDEVPPLSSSLLWLLWTALIINFIHLIASTAQFKSSTKYVSGVSNSSAHCQGISSLFIWFHLLNCRCFGVSGHASYPFHNFYILFKKYLLIDQLIDWVGLD